VEDSKGTIFEMLNAMNLKSTKKGRKQEKEEVMGWKYPNKVCKCNRPKAGVFCGRFPFPTD
jgi:hypothetical protein